MEKLQRFLKAQERDYERALKEIKNGRKQTHWMWFIFPQIAGLGYSDITKYYAITNRAEAQAYISHPVLGKRLVEISHALLENDGASALKIFGTPDDLKLKSCMTLFGSLPKADPVFEAVLQKYFEGAKDHRTILLLKSEG